MKISDYCWTAPDGKHAMAYPDLATMKKYYGGPFCLYCGTNCRNIKDLPKFEDDGSEENLFPEGHRFEPTEFP